jgi:hypothetical protein
MKNVTVKLTALVLLLVVWSGVASAQTQPLNVVTTAVPFLRISPDARGGGMGDLGVATSADANSAFWNLSKTPFNVNKGGIALTYTPWLQGLDIKDVYLACLTGYYKLDDIQAISGSLRYFSLGNIQFTDNNGSELGQYRPREFSIEGGYSRKLSEKLGVGLMVRYINSSLASGDPNNSGTVYQPGTSVAADISMFHTGVKENGQGLNYGVSVSNLGTKISYTNDATQKDFIPANLGIGATYTSVFNSDSKMTFGADINKLLVPTPPEVGDSTGLAEYRNMSVVSSWFKSFGDAPGGASEELAELTFSLGTEFWYQNQFAFRAGYFFESPSKGNRQYFTVGAGLKYEMFGLNFSYLIPSGSGVNRNPLSNTIRFGIIFDFGATGGATAEPK